jgi:hypothetical protein
MRFPALCWLAAYSVMLSGCRRGPESYSPPEQHLRFRPHGVPASEFLAMDHPELPKAVVKDVNVSEPGPWKWTGADPELRFELPSADNWTFLVDFVINDRTFRDTGPVTVRFFVNDHLAGEERYTSYGDKTFEKFIPAEWLKGRGETRVRMHIDPVWPNNGVNLGVLLKRVGFVE